MDFGSSVCMRNNPTCNSCVMNDSCKFAPLYKSEKKVMFVMEKRKEKGVTENSKHVPNRIFRGRIVEFVRKNEGRNISLNELGKKIKKDFKDEGEWLLSLIVKLEKDGLIEFTSEEKKLKLVLAQ